MNPAPNSDPSSYMNLLRGLTGLYPAANSTNNGLIMINPLQMYNLLMETKPALVSCSSPSSSSSSCGSVNRNNLPTSVMMTPLIPEDTENRPASSGPVDRTKLFVGNLPANTPLPELLELFTPFGPINHQLCVVKDDNYAFVHFYSNKSAEDAVRAVNGAFFHGRYLRVEYSVSDGHLRKVIRQKGSLASGIYKYKNSKSSYDMINSKLSNGSTPTESNPIVCGLRAIRGSQQRLPTIDSDTKFGSF